MKNIYLIVLLLPFIAASCVKQPKAPDTNVDINRFLTTKTLAVPVQEGFVTIVTGSYDDTIATIVSPTSIYVPKGEDIKFSYHPIPSSDGNTKANENNTIDFEKNNSLLFQVVCFEDSMLGDYDYNDFVFHVQYQRSSELFGFGIHPVALGSVNDMYLGCVVYEGDTPIFDDIITRDPQTNETTTVRQQLFEGQTGFLNTVGNVINQTTKGKPNTCWHEYLGSTIRNFKISDPASPVRVEWYITSGRANSPKIFALSTKYITQSFDKTSLPYGLVISGTGYTYTDSHGNVCGKDWFNYPKETEHIKDVYPQIWDWMNSNNSYVFSDVYDPNPETMPSNAFPAIILKIYEANSLSRSKIFDTKYLQN